MTKYGKTKKLMKETGISKKEAQDFLRRAGWKYEDAKMLWAVSKLPEINFEKILDDISKEVTNLIEKLPEIINEIVENLAPIIQKITEAAAEVENEEKIRAQLDNQIKSVKEEWGDCIEKGGEQNEN